MPKKIRAERVGSALNNMANWRGKAKSQGATHLIPTIALIERGAGDPPGKAVLMNETPHEFAFWDKYFHLDDGNDVKPYFNPVTLRRAEAGFPNSNSATTGRILSLESGMPQRDVRRTMESSGNSRRTMQTFSATKY